MAIIYLCFWVFLLPHMGGFLQRKPVPSRCHCACLFLDSEPEAVPQPSLPRQWLGLENRIPAMIHCCGPGGAVFLSIPEFPTVGGAGIPLQGYGCQGWRRHGKDFLHFIILLNKKDVWFSYAPYIPVLLYCR